MYLYLKVIFNKLSRNDLFAIKTGRKILEKLHGSHHLFLEKLYIDLEKSYSKSSKNFLENIIDEKRLGNIILSQYLSKSFNNFNFTKVILISVARKKKISLPIPFLWFNIFEQKGIKISKISCFILFFFQGIFRLALGFKNLLILYKINLLKINKFPKIDNFLFNPTIENLPSNNSYKDFSLISELTNKKMISKDDTSVLFVKNKYNLTKIKETISKNNLNFSLTSLDYPSCIGYFGLFRLSLYFFYLIFLSFIKVLFLKLEEINFFEEIIKYKAVQYANKKFLPNKIFFNNSNWKYKPLWTYQAELKGSNISVYFYSLSESGYKIKYQSNYDIQGLHNLVWKNYYTWNKYHTQFLKNLTKSKCAFIETGPISFKDCENNIDKTIDLNNCIAVFDAAPYKEAFSTLFAMDSSNYRSYKNILKFIDDIKEICETYNIGIIYKTKKFDSKQISKFYLNKIKIMKKNLNFFEIDSNISPKNYVDDCICSINFPFTSTAHLSKKSKKSIFYDPTMTILSNDPAANGIKIINDKQDLNLYIQQIK